MKKFVLAPALAALAMFLFGFLYWGTTTLPYRVVSSAGDDSAAALALGKIFPATGTYLVPGMNTPEPQRGPFALVHFVKGDIPKMDPKLLAQGYAHEFMLCLLLVIMLRGAAPSFKCFSCRVKFATMIGLIVVAADLGNAIWWHHALSWELVQGLYTLGSFVVAGFVLAFFLTPKRDAAPAAA